MSVEKARGGRPAGDRAAQRQRVIEATWRVIGAEGLEGASMRAIARELDATTGVLAHYFRSKQELLLFAIRSKFDALDAAYEATAAMVPARDALRAIALEALPRDAASRLEWTVYLAFVAQAPRQPAFRRELGRRARTMRAHARSVLARGAVDGSLAAIEDPDRVIDALQSAIEGLGQLAMVEGRRFDSRRQEALVDTLIEGLLGA